MSHAIGMQHAAICELTTGPYTTVTDPSPLHRCPKLILDLIHNNVQKLSHIQDKVYMNTFMTLLHFLEQW